MIILVKKSFPNNKYVDINEIIINDKKVDINDEITFFLDTKKKTESWLLDFILKEKYKKIKFDDNIAKSIHIPYEKLTIRTYLQLRIYGNNTINRLQKKYRQNSDFNVIELVDFKDEMNYNIEYNDLIFILEEYAWDLIGGAILKTHYVLYVYVNFDISKLKHFIYYIYIHNFAKKI